MTRRTCPLHRGDIVKYVVDDEECEVLIPRGEREPMKDGTDGPRLVTVEHPTLGELTTRRRQLLMLRARLRTHTPWDGVGDRPTS